MGANRDGLRALLADAETPLPWAIGHADSSEPDPENGHVIAHYEGPYFVCAAVMTGEGDSARRDSALIVAAVNAAPELLAAAAERDRLAGEIDRRVAAGTKATVDAVSALSQRCGELSAELLEARRSAFDEHGKTRDALRAVEGERDRARDAAAALEAENAVLRPAVDEVTARRAFDARATGPNPWADAAELRAGVLVARDRMVAEESEWTSGPGPEYCEIRQALTDLLARTDPLRTDGGETDG